MQKDLKLQNEIAALADSDFDSSRIQSSSESGLAIPMSSIASLVSLQAAGCLSSYHSIAKNLFSESTYVWTCGLDAKSGSAVGGTGLQEARVLPNISWLQCEPVRAHTNARHSSCQSATALGMGCATIIALSNIRHPMSDVGHERTIATRSGGGCSGDVCNNGHPRSRAKLATGQAGFTVYLHTRYRFSFYFCANMRPIACERSCPRSGRLAQNAVCHFKSRDMKRQLVDAGWFSLFTRESSYAPNESVNSVQPNIRHPMSDIGLLDTHARGSDVRVRNDIDDLSFIASFRAEKRCKLFPMRYRRKIARAGIIKVATPTVALQEIKRTPSVLHSSSTPFRKSEVKRVQMDVKRNVLKMLVALDVNPLVLSLPERSRAVVAFVKVFRVSHAELLHKKRYAVLNKRRKEQMEVIWHQTESMYSHQQFPSATFFASVGLCWMKRKGLIIENKKVVYKSHAITVVHHHVTLIDAAIQYMEEFRLVHPLILAPQIRHPMSDLGIVSIHA